MDTEAVKAPQSCDKPREEDSVILELEGVSKRQGKTVFL